MKFLTKRISLTLIFFLIALAFTIQISYSATQKTFTLNWDNPVFRYEEYALNDSSTTKDLLFTTAENKTVWLKIPKNSTIWNSTITLTGRISPAQQTGTSVAFYSVAVGNVTGKTYNDISIGAASQVFLFNSSLNQVWSYSTGSIVSGIAIGNILPDSGDEIAVASSDEARVYILNSSGSQKWNFPTDGRVSSVAIGNVTRKPYNDIVIGADKAYLLNSSGDINWTYAGAGTIYSVAVGDITSDLGNEVIIGNNSGIQILNSSGNLIRDFFFGTGKNVKSLAVGDITSDTGNEIIAGLNNGSVYVLNSTLNIKWAYTVGGIVYSVAVGDITSDPGNEIAVGSSNNKVYVLNSTGSFIWSYTASSEVWGVAVGDISSDPLNETVAVSNDKNVYVLNFEYYPTNVSIDIENDGDYDWTNSGKLRTNVTIQNSSLTSAIQNYLNNCNSQNCNVPLVFHSDFGGDLNITFINVTYDYNASEAISYQNISAWSRTNNTLVNETIGNRTINISCYSNPANSIQVSYVKISNSATTCDFSGITYTNATVDGQNVCSITAYTVVTNSSNLLWDNTMDSGIAIYANETLSNPPVNEAGTWSKNVTIWNETATTFYNVTANTSINIGYISDAGLFVEWGGTFNSITPSSNTSNCNSTNPTYKNIPIGTDNFYVCKQDTNGDGQADFFKWKQPHTSATIYIVNGTTNHLALLSYANVTPSSGKWNITNFNFSIFVNDSVDRDNVTVNFWLKVDGLNWEMKESKNISGNGTAWFNYTANESWIGTNYYMFEYRDFNSTTGYIYHSWQNTSNYTNPTVLKHDVSIIYILGNNTSVNRTGSNYTAFSFVVNDTDLDRNVSNANCVFWITTDGSNFILANSNTTNTSGFCDFNFNPNATYSARQQLWKGGTYQDNYYSDANSTNYTVTIVGGLNINFTESVINQNFTRGNNINLLAKLIDENNNIATVSGYTCTWYINNTEKASLTTNISGYCNYTWETNCSSKLDVYHINVTLSGSASPYYIIERNMSYTNVTLKDNLNLSIIRPLSNQIAHEQENVTLNSTTTDSCGTPSESYNVTWYYLSTDACSQMNPIATGYNTTWQLPLYPGLCVPQVLTIIANATGEYYNSNQKSIQMYLFGWSKVSIKDPLKDTEINRSLPSIGEKYNVVCFVEDANISLGIGSYTVNFWYSNSSGTYSIGNNATSITNPTVGNATYLWNISDFAISEGFYDVKCNISDDPDNLYNASIAEDKSINIRIIGSSDLFPPEFLDVIANSALQNVENVTINANISDFYGVDKVWVNITFPNKTSTVYNLANTSSNNKRGIWNISLNFTELGDYDFRLYANDTSGNNVTTTGWFEVYPATVQFYGNMTDATGRNVTAEFIFYRNGTNSIIHRNSTSLTNVGYNLTIRKRNYDVEFRVFNHTLKFLSANITNNMSNSISFDNIPQSKIPLITGVRNRLLGLAVTNTFNFSDVNITLNFTDASKENPSRFFASDVDIYRCSNWNFTTRNCSSTSTNLGGTPLPTADPKVVTVTTQSLSAFFAGDTANPNDGICDPGESCSYDSACCGGSTGQTTGSGGGGGGGAAIAQCGNGICESGENRDNCPKDCGTPETIFSLRTNLTDVQLDPGQEDTYALWITNNINSNINASISIFGAVTNFINLEKSSITVEPKKEEMIKIYVKIPSDEGSATYSGQISVTSYNKTQTLPITLKISAKGEKELDVIINLLDKKVGLNDTVRSQITLYDTGYIRKFNASFFYYIKKVDTEEIVYSETETNYIERTQSFVKKIDLSELEIKPGKYLFEVKIKYDEREASASDEFEVITTFWTSRRISQITIIVLTTTSIVSILYARKRYFEWKIGKARYIFPIDFGKLPVGKLWVGKIAETDRKTYFDMNELKTHVLVAGATGAGKSVSATIFVEELLREKIPVIVFDPTAQWTGFVRPCKDPNLLKYYKQFNMNISDTRPYTGMIYEINDPNVKIDFKKYMNPGEITVFTLNKLKPGQYDIAVSNIIDEIFAQGWEESTKLRMVVVFDEVHRLLEKYGGTGGYISLEKACREFRKWGIGLIMVSQVLSDFKEAIKGNVLTEIQLHTKSLGDLARIEKKYGLEYAKKVTKLEVGVGMIQNPKYNEGRPYFIAFRPTLHEPHKISDVELETYKEYASLLDIIESNIEVIEKTGKDVFELRTEFKLAKDKLKKGRFRMAKIYIDSLRKQLNIGEGNTRRE